MISLIIPNSSFLINPRMFPNLGILYLSSVLKKNGYEVEVIDLSGGKELPDKEYDIVGITATTPQFPSACRLLYQIKERNPNSYVVIGGPHATVDPYSCLNAGFDSVVVGEGERAILKIARGERSRIYNEPYIRDLDEIPFPDRDEVIHNYHAELDGIKCTNQITSRGCVWGRCIFCARTWDKVRYHSPDYVLSEARLLKELYGIGAIWFFDDEFTMSRRDFRIFYGLKDLGLIYRCFTRSDFINEDVAKRLSETGCREVLIGVESGSNKIKEIIRKGTTVETDKKAIKLLYEAGVRVKATFIVGLPSETVETLEETERFCEEVKDMVSDFDFSILAVYPGSYLFNHPDEFDLKWKYVYGYYKGKPEEYVCNVRTSQLNEEELLYWRDRLERRFKPKERLR
jgi:anaerobic magnesium-protoporphyrin IX monomethyl ester cyclase